MRLLTTAELKTGTDKGIDCLDMLWAVATRQLKAEHPIRLEMRVAAQRLEVTHPIRLGIAFYVSVRWYHLSRPDTPDIAVDKAKGAFDNAIEGLDGLSEEKYKDSTMAM